MSNLKEQADAVRRAALRNPSMALADAEKTLCQLNALATELLVRIDDEDLSDKVALDLLAILRLPAIPASS